MNVNKITETVPYDDFEFRDDYATILLTDEKSKYG